MCEVSLLVTVCVCSLCRRRLKLRPQYDILQLHCQQASVFVWVCVCLFLCVCVCSLLAGGGGGGGRKCNCILSPPASYQKGEVYFKYLLPICLKKNFLNFWLSEFLLPSFLNKNFLNVCCQVVWRKTFWIFFTKFSEEKLYEFGGVGQGITCQPMQWREIQHPSFLIFSLAIRNLDTSLYLWYLE